MRKISKIVTALCLTIQSIVFAQNKPSIWIHTDFTSALSYTVNGSVATAVTDDSDPDDQVAMAMYLMMANKFDTRAIIVASTTRNLKFNSLDGFNKTFGVAYNNDLPKLNSEIGGYPTLVELNVKESSLTDNTVPNNGHLSYSESPANKYDNFSTLPQTVKDLINELKNNKYSSSNPLYVLVWGPMTEVAMATKHMIRNNMTTELSRMHVISHWTSSFLNQTGTPCSSFPSNQIQFKPANCNQNCESCAFMHNEAKKNGASFKFVDLGSVGQGGVVNGSASFFKGGNSGVNGTQYNEFKKSMLGDLFVKSKFSSGKPDGSDCATFLALLGTYDVKLSDYNNNGVLTQAHETSAQNAFKNSAPRLMQDLLNISNKIANASTPINTCTLPANAVAQATAASCNATDGKITFTFDDIAGRTFIRFSIDGGNSYFPNVSSNSGTFVANGLASGTYNCFAMWVNGDCPTRIGSVTIGQLTCNNTCSTPGETTVSKTNAACNSADGKITFDFNDTPGRTGIKFSINGGSNYSSTVSDASSEYVFEGLSSGTYNCYVAWGNNDCPTSLGTVSVGENTCNNGGTPTTITDLTAVQNTNCGVVLTWGDVSGETAYRIRRKVAGQNSFINLGDVNANVTTYTDNTASSNTTYVYQVRPVVNNQAVEVSNLPEIKTNCAGSAARFGEVEEASSLSIYPSPASDFVSIEGLVEGELLQLYSMEGVLLFETSTSSSIQVSAYPTGVYLIKTQGQTFKFVKE